MHFTPPTGWMNDPNGLVHADGVFHLCYQHHPADLLWGPMHWGHATSHDLLTWQHQQIALAPDHLGTAFSGSAVVDHDGVAGFGAGALVAFYTHFQEGVPQSQGVAASTDGGTTWTPYAGNPVLAGPEGLLDFRDPKVLRYGPDTGSGTGHWVMVVAGGDQVFFHRSEDLLHWTECGRFGRGYGAHGGDWETPDLFPLDVEGTGERRWVLVVSVLAGAPAGGSGSQYFVGDFDGQTFVPDDLPDEVRWVDHGADFYAPQSWSDAPDGRRIWLAWMSNWDYARTTPASTWRGAMTVPRDVLLRRSGDRLVLAQQPVREFEDRGLVAEEHHDLVLDPGAAWEPAVRPAAYDLSLRLAADDEPSPAGPEGAAARALEVEVHRGSAPGTRISWLPALGVLQVRRPVVGIEGAEPHAVQEVALGASGELDLRIVVDTGSVEVFADDGRTVLSNQVFPVPGDTGLAVRVEGAAVVVRSLRLRDIT